jgi:hypothetical protein
MLAGIKSFKIAYTVKNKYDLKPYLAKSDLVPARCDLKYDFKSDFKSHLVYFNVALKATTNDLWIIN